MTDTSDLNALIFQVRADEQRLVDSDPRIDPLHHLRYNAALADLTLGAARDGVESALTSLYKRSWDRQRNGGQQEATYRRALVHVAARMWGTPPEQAREQIETMCGPIQYQGKTT